EPAWRATLARASRASAGAERGQSVTGIGNGDRRGGGEVRQSGGDPVVAVAIPRLHHVGNAAVLDENQGGNGLQSVINGSGVWRRIRDDIEGRAKLRREAAEPVVRILSHSDHASGERLRQLLRDRGGQLTHRARHL